jgi:hypothetical protein
MARAVLEIDGDVSGLVAAFGAAETAAKKAEGAARRTGGVYRENARTMVAAERQIVAEAQRSVAAQARAEQQKIRAARMSADARKRAEQEATRVAQEEARKRGLSAEQEARTKQNALERYTRIYEAEERRQTQIAEREARKRQQEFRKAQQEQRRGDAVAGRIVGQVARAGMQFAGSAHSVVQDARRQRAMSQRTIAQAVMGGGGTAADIQETQRRASTFVQQTGISMDVVAEALAIGQQRGSALQPGAGESRSTMLDEVFNTIREANATNTNAGQLLAARGRLAARGLRGEALKDALRFTVRAADLGSVEVDQIIQQGLPGAARLMETRTAMLGPGATEDERQRAALAAYRESVALQEVTAGSGNAPRNMSNTLANLQAFLRTPRRQEAILTNIQTAEEQANINNPAGRARRDALRALRESLFERDPTRTGNAMRMKAGTNPLELAARMTEAMGGDANAAMSLLAGGGHGNAQSLLSNMRGLLEFLGRSDATGRTGGARVTEMMNAAAVTDAEVNARERVVENDQLAQMTRAQEAGIDALTDNTNALVDLSNKFADWSARNPLASAAGSSAGSLLAGVVGGRITSGAAFTAARGAIQSAVPAGVRGVAGRIGGAIFGMPAMLAAGLSAVGAYGGTDQSEVERQRREGAEWERQSAALTARARAEGRPPPTAGEIGTAVVNALRSQPLVATVSPTDATHAAQQQPVATPPAR